MPDIPPRDGELLAEDLLLLLVDPRSGSIVGEGTLYWTLGGAALTELALADRLEVEDRGWRGRTATARGSIPPQDAILAGAWEVAARKPREVQGLIAAVGPALRAPLLDRLVAHDHVVRTQRKVLGLVPTTSLSLGGSGRRAQLMEQVRAVLADGAEPEPRTRALAALLSAGGALPSLHREIPWSSATYARGTRLAEDPWAAAAAQAVLSSSVLAATAIATSS